MIHKNNYYFIILLFKFYKRLHELVGLDIININSNLNIPDL